MFAEDKLGGHEKALRDQDQVGDLEFVWTKEYGHAFHINGAVGVRS